LELTCIMK